MCVCLYLEANVYVTGVSTCPAPSILVIRSPCVWVVLRTLTF